MITLIIPNSGLTRLSGIQDKLRYTETLIIPNPLNKAHGRTGLPEKIRDNIFYVSVG